MQNSWARALVATVLTLMVLSFGGTAVVADDSTFDSLTSHQHVYDDTGNSLSAGAKTDLRARSRELRDQTDADETLGQVEALQQAWVDTSGAKKDTAVAILINRNPDTDARAGIFVGSTFDLSLITLVTTRVEGLEEFFGVGWDGGCGRGDGSAAGNDGGA